jgi:hypothetical protein
MVIIGHIKVTTVSHFQKIVKRYETNCYYEHDKVQKQMRKLIQRPNL